jgi:phage I-like protein
MTARSTALLAATLDVAADGTAQLLPAGEFAARDGRPGNGLQWRVDDAQGIALADSINEVAARTPIVVDYDHATLTTRGTGHTAPAAGWIRSVQWLAGKGLLAAVEWTDRARQLIRSREYRYISPVIEFDAVSGVVTGVLMAALVNFPALLGMDAVHALSSFAAAGGAPLHAQQDRTMNQPSTTTAAAAAAHAAPVMLPGADAGVQAQIAALQGEIATLRARPPVLGAALIAALGLQPAADEAAALSAVAALRTAADGAGAALQQVATLQGEIATLRATQADAEIVRSVDGVIAEGKFVPAQRDTLLATGRANGALLKAWIDGAQPIAALTGAHQQAARAATAAAAGADANKTMTPEARKVASLMGITPDEYIAFRAAQAAKASQAA